MNVPYTVLAPADPEEMPSKESRHAFSELVVGGTARRSRQRVMTTVTAILVLAVLFFLGDTARSYAARHSDKPVMIIMADSREPFVPTNPDVPIPYMTITALINHHYAQQVGADFVFYVLEKPPKEPPYGANDPVCKHPRLGWRAAAWCKLPAVWESINAHPGTDGFIFIDSDAAFRNETLAPERHLSHLTRHRPIGFLSNKPFDDGLCTGYFFLNRLATGFLKDWWNTDVQQYNLERLWEQDGLTQLLQHGVAENEVTLANLPYMDRLVHLSHEGQFEIDDKDQLIHHLSSMEKDREKLIRAMWRNPTVTLADRAGIIKLAESMKVVRLNATEVAIRMGESR